MGKPSKYTLSRGKKRFRAPSGISAQIREMSVFPTPFGGSCRFFRYSRGYRLGSTSGKVWGLENQTIVGLVRFESVVKFGGLVQSSTKTGM